MFEPDTLSIGSVDNPGTVQEEEENPSFDSPCPGKDTTENDRNKINSEDVESNHTRSKENSVEDEGDFSDAVFNKEKLRQESKESDTAEAANHVSNSLEIAMYFL